MNNIDKNKLSVNTYNEIALEYEKAYGDDLTDTVYIDKFLESLVGKNVLDIGCGVGNFTNYIYEKGFNVKGLDLAEEMLKIAKEKYKNIVFYNMDMRNITLNEKFDGLVLAYSLIHLPKKDVESVLKKYYEMLNKNGKILIILQGGYGEHIIDEPLKDGLKLFLNYYSLEEITKLLNKLKFKIIYSDIRKSNGELELDNDKIIIICQKENK